MNYITLDFSGIKSLWTLHEYFKNVFELPDYYGHNMDALWDCLHCYYDEPTTIVLNNIEKLPNDMDKIVETMIALFKELERRNDEVTIIVNQDDGDISGYMN